MDFLEKLDYLMHENDLNKNSLSKACDIPYTTIDGWYKKGYEGLKLPTLKKLANYFGTTLDYWANDDIIEPIEIKQRELLNCFNELPNKYKDYILHMSKELLHLQQQSHESP